MLGIFRPSLSVRRMFIELKVMGGYVARIWGKEVGLRMVMDFSLL